MWGTLKLHNFLFITGNIFINCHYPGLQNQIFVSWPTKEPQILLFCTYSCFSLLLSFHSSFLNMVFIVGGVPELYEPACHFRCCKHPVAILQPPRAKKLKSKSKKHRVISSFMPKDTQSSSVWSFKSLRTLCSTPATEGRPSLQFYIGANLGKTRCFWHRCALSLPFSTPHLPSC